MINFSPVFGVIPQYLKNEMNDIIQSFPNVQKEQHLFSIWNRAQKTRQNNIHYILSKNTTAVTSHIVQLLQDVVSLPGKIQDLACDWLSVKMVPRFRERYP